METVEDLMIGGYKIYQDDTLYRFTSDAVLLSHFATVKNNDLVADFCSGSGIVGLNLFAYNEKSVKSVTLFEMQKSLFDLSVKSIKANGLENKIFAKNIKLQDISYEYNETFSLIVCNPPYMEKDNGFYEEKEEIAVCKREITLSLSELCFIASKKLKYGGRFALCNRADRLSEVIFQLKSNNIEPKKLQLVYSGKAKEPYLIMIEGVKGGKPSLKILPPVRN